MPGRGPFDLEIDALGHRGLRGRFELHPEQVFLLDPLGSLVISFVGERGDPVEGVQVLLLPPIETGQGWSARWRVQFEAQLALAKRGPRPPSPSAVMSPGVTVADAFSEGESGSDSESSGRDALSRGWVSRNFFQGSPKVDWRATSGADGQVHWDDLPAAEDYRWGLLSNHSLLLSPPHEAPEFVALDEGFRRNGRAPQGLSGPIAVAGGATTHLQIRVYDRTGVAGRLMNADGSPARSVHLRIFHGTEYRDGRGENLSVFDVERRVPSDAEGRFVAAGIQPGEKRLSAAWDVGGQNFYFGFVPFDLPPGQLLDLGDLYPLRGSTLEGLVLFRDENGNDLRASDLFGREIEASAIVFLANRTQSASPESALSEALSVRFERPFFLHGLPAGLWRLACDRGFDLPPARGTGSLGPEEPEVLVTVPATSPAILPFIARSSVQIRVVAAYPPGAPRFPIRLDLVREGGGCSERVRVRPPRGGVGGEAETVVAIPVGRYSARFHPEGDSASSRNTSFFAVTSFEVAAGGTTEVRVELQPGAAVGGVAVGLDGVPLRRFHLLLSPAGWRAKGSNPWICQVETDEEGRFLLTGLAPGDPLEAFGVEDRIEVGLAGSESEVLLRVFNGLIR